MSCLTDAPAVEIKSPELKNAEPPPHLDATSILPGASDGVDKIFFLPPTDPIKPRGVPVTDFHSPTLVNPCRQSPKYA